MSYSGLSMRIPFKNHETDAPIKTLCSCVFSIFPWILLSVSFVPFFSLRFVESGYFTTLMRTNHVYFLSFSTQVIHQHTYICMHITRVFTLYLLHDEQSRSKLKKEKWSKRKRKPIYVFYERIADCRMRFMKGTKSKVSETRQTMRKGKIEKNSHKN